MTKQETRAHARRLNLPVSEKAESQDICFVPDGNYAGVVTKLRPDAAVPGDIVHVDGRVLGRHNGIIHYTVGQRRGLGIGGGEALYVVALDAASHRVIVGPKQALARDRVMVQGINWIGPSDPPASGVRVAAKLRSLQPPRDGTLFVDPDGSGTLHLDNPQFGVAPGQAAVFYSGDDVLGGGWIEATDLTAMAGVA